MGALARPAAARGGSRDPAGARRHVARARRGVGRLLLATRLFVVGKLLPAPVAGHEHRDQTTQDTQNSTHDENHDLLPSGATAMSMTGMLTLANGSIRTPARIISRRDGS